VCHTCFSFWPNPEIDASFGFQKAEVSPGTLSVVQRFDLQCDRRRAVHADVADHGHLDAGQDRRGDPNTRARLGRKADKHRGTGPALAANLPALLAAFLGVAPPRPPSPVLATAALAGAPRGEVLVKSPEALEACRGPLCNAPGSDGGKVNSVAAFLESADRVLVCTHATFRFAVDKAAHRRG
jgi:hypothetical protein